MSDRTTPRQWKQEGFADIEGCEAIRILADDGKVVGYVWDEDDAETIVRAVAAEPHLQTTINNLADQIENLVLAGQMTQDARESAERQRNDLIVALRAIAALSDKPDDYEWYDNWHDPVGVDVSNSGDWHDFGTEQGRHEAAKMARAALKNLGGQA